jgi:hypothetical protein
MRVREVLSERRLEVKWDEHVHRAFGNGCRVSGAAWAVASGRADNRYSIQFRVMRGHRAIGGHAIWSYGIDVGPVLANRDDESDFEIEYSRWLWAALDAAKKSLKAAIEAGTFRGVYRR